MMLFRDKIVLVTRKTRLEELVERFNTRKQAKFYIEHMGLDFSEYEQEHEVYSDAVRRLKHDLGDLGRKLQFIDWTYLPNFIFTPQDAVVTVGRDGLVSNTAKYLDGQAPPLPRLRLAWEDPRLAFVVREPFRSRASDVRLAAGLIDAGEELRLESHMPEGGVIFSDGVEADAIAFSSGAVATVRAAARQTRLVAA